MSDYYIRLLNMKNIIFIALLSFTFLKAYDDPSLFSLSLEELMNIEVTSTSKRFENQNLASGIVTVITSQEIKKFGARNLRDVIDRLVGMQVLSSHQRPHNKTSIRAMNGAHQEGWELLLLNGRPIHDGTDGGFNFDIYLGFPLEMIEHIEVIRGPGSVIYGTNAMVGVINIITKDARKSINESTIDISMGSFNRRQLQLTSLIGGIDYSLNIGLNSIRANGDSIGGVVDKDNIAGNYDSGENSDNLVFNGAYKHFTINGMIMKNDADSGGSSFQLPSSPMVKERIYLDIGYIYEITNFWDLSLNYTINKGEFDWQINEAKGRNHYDDRYDMVEMLVRGNIDKNLNLLFGLNSSNYETEFNLGLPSSSMSSKSAYAQIDYMLSPKQKLIGGIQLNEPENIKSDVSSRIGFIQGFGDNLWLKLLYSEAYRSPNLQEAKINAPTLKGNPSLNPEKVATYDVQLIHQALNHYLAISLYDSKLENVIVRVPGSPTTFINKGYINYQGIEIEGRIELDNDISVICNFSYQTNKTNSSVKDSTFAPNMMVKIGASYDATYGMNISAFNSYIGESTDLTVTNNAALRNQKADAHNLLTMNVSIDTAQMWGIGKVGNSLLTIYLDNILDENVYTPNLNYVNGSNTIPHHWGRSVNLTYTYKF